MSQPNNKVVNKINFCLIQSPKFWFIILVPVSIFIFDRIIGMRKNYKQLRVIDAAILPSGLC